MTARVSRAKSNMKDLRSAISPPPTSRKRRRSSPVQAASPNNATTDATRSAVEPRSGRSLRIFSWNVNGISPFIQPSITSFFFAGGRANPMPASPSLRAFLKRNHWPQILNLQEVKINPSDEVTKSAVQKAVNRRASDIEDEGPEYTVRFCLPRDKYNAKGFGRKVYGVATVMRKDYFEQDVTICREVDWDLEGRVLVVETKSKLAVLNLYCVNGTDNDYKDSATGQVVGTRHDRKLAFHKLLLKECKDLETQGFRVVVTGDLNISPRPIDGFPKLRTVPEQHVQNRADYNHKFLDEKNMDGLRAIDSFRHLHPTTRKYSWLSTTRPWLSSCDRVDHILLSRSMVDDHDMISHADGSHATSGEGIQSSSDDTEPKVILLEADILMTEADRSPSDHCPIFVTLDVD